MPDSISRILTRLLFWSLVHDMQVSLSRRFNYCDVCMPRAQPNMLQMADPSLRYNEADEAIIRGQWLNKMCVCVCHVQFYGSMMQCFFMQGVQNLWHTGLLVGWDQ